MSEDETTTEEIQIKVNKRVYKPDISKLQNAIDNDGNFLPKKGDAITIQYSEYWRDTETLCVHKINYETGDVVMTSNSGFRFTNFKSGPTKYGQLIKISSGKFRMKNEEK
jgi:hypothetical protein